MEYDIIIGLEIHAELKTKSKMFCRCRNESDNREANTNTCPICLGHPGTLPLPNKQAIEWTILLGLGLGCQINYFTKFDRKNYFYPDLPKGYQISQYDLPLAYNGQMEIDGKNIKITRIHLEEDTGKTRHPEKKDYSLVDYNRSSAPLIEMVTDPVIEDATTAKKFCQNYQQVLRYLDISDADMEKGQMRCEANVSLQVKDSWKYNQESGEIEATKESTLNPKVEIKNINSFKAIEKAINYEIKRQKELLSSGEKIIQETRGWKENKAKTSRQRVKETAADYRYFPEPDIPPINLDKKWVESIRSELLELPPEKKKRFQQQYDFDQEIAEILVSNKDLSSYSENVISELRAWITSDGDDWERQKTKLAKAAANWLVGELFKHLRESGEKISDIKITPGNFAELIFLVYKNKINSSAGQKILESMYKKGGKPSSIMKDLGLEQLDDEAELETIVKDILDKNTDQVDQYKQGKTNVLQYFVGQAMARTKGKANPQKVLEILKKILDK